MSRSVALVTYAGEPELTADDRLLQAALGAHGVDASAVDWDADADWTRFDAIVIRSPWDYYKRYDEFTAWLDRLERSGAPVYNPVPLLRWNSTKAYLRQLDESGVAVPPTAWFARGEHLALRRLMQERHWETVVVKPTISATAYHTYRIGPDVSAEDQRKVDDLVASRDVMVQPYLDEVASAGELSLLFFNGTYSHAVLKRPRWGDFRVQTDFGGSVESITPSPLIITEAARVVAAAPAPTLYARVDGCIVGGHFMLMELEAVEPCLFFAYDAGSADGLAAAMMHEMENSNRATTPSSLPSRGYSRANP